MDLESQATPFTAWGEKGKPSIISQYCADTLNAKHIQCLWICYEQSDGIRAKDIRLDAQATTFDMKEILRHIGWWRRVSMHSVVKIQAVEMQFNHITKDDKIYVFPRPLRHEVEISAIDEAIERLRGQIQERGVCGISSDGGLHGATEHCPNAIHDEEIDFWCPRREIYRKKCQRDKILNAAEALQFHWTMRKSPMSLVELRDAGFVCTYEGLQTLYFFDARRPYGQSVKAIRLVLGWRWKYVATLCAGGLVTSICVAVLVSLFTHDLSSGWAAGSYTVAVVALLLTLFTFLSGVL